MAESTVANGVASESKIAALERERDELATENAKKSEEIKKLKAEIERLRGNSAEAEGEAAMSAEEEARAEAEELRKVVEERECRIEILEREGKGLKQGNAESEMKVRDLERKIGVYEMREVEERSKRVRVEEEMRERVGEKEREIEGLKREIQELENVLTGGRTESEKWLKENRDLEEKVRVLELSVKSMKEKALNANDGVNVCGEGKELELKWPVVAAGSAGAIAAVAVLIRFCFGKRR